MRKPSHYSDLVFMSAPDVRPANTGRLKPGRTCPRREIPTRDHLSTLLVDNEITDFWLTPEGWTVRLDEGGEWVPFDASSFSKATVAATQQAKPTVRHAPQGARRDATMSTTKKATTPRGRKVVKTLPQEVTNFLANLVHEPKREFAMAAALAKFCDGPAPTLTGAGYEDKAIKRLDRIAKSLVAA